MHVRLKRRRITFNKRELGELGLVVGMITTASHKSVASSAETRPFREGVNFVDELAGRSRELTTARRRPLRLRRRHRVLRRRQLIRHFLADNIRVADGDDSPAERFTRSIYKYDD